MKDALCKSLNLNRLGTIPTSPTPSEYKNAITECDNNVGWMFRCVLDIEFQAVDSASLN